MIFNRRGVSYAISAVIMTATIIVLVLVTSTYTYQVLEQQRGAAEFAVAKKSILAFDDALENIAWKPQGARSARFTVNYGQLELVPDMRLIVNVTGYEGANYSVSTGYVKYRTKTMYVNFGANYASYLLGNDEIISNGTGSYGRALIEQNSGWVTLNLAYGVRAMKTYTINVTEGDQQVLVNYVDIWIISIEIAKWSTYIGDFDLIARCLNITTIPYGSLHGNGYDVLEDKCNISVRLGDNALDTTLIQLDGSKVVFNFVIATVRVSV
ncbi:MAG: hypothetical protein NWE91_05465 [Candidatus Bathyarchaeota archaeon]|nr:hypothetical protein [Candidatus Bathyarchaeota archaeon]